MASWLPQGGQNLQFIQNQVDVKGLFFARFFNKTCKVTLMKHYKVNLIFDQVFYLNRASQMNRSRTFRKLKIQTFFFCHTVSGSNKLCYFSYYIKRTTWLSNTLVVLGFKG